MAIGNPKDKFVSVGERIRYIGASRYRYENWPENAWLEKGITGTVTEYHEEDPAVTISGELFEAIPPYAVVTWDFGGKTAIDAEYEGETWERNGLPRGGNPEDSDKRLLKVAIERKPLGVAKQLGYEVHRLSPTDIVDKDDYARGYRYRLTKTDPTQPYPQIVMARSEVEVATFLKRQTIGGNPPAVPEFSAREALWDEHYQKVKVWLEETKGDPNARYSLAELEAERPELYKEYVELSKRPKPPVVERVTPEAVLLPDIVPDKIAAMESLLDILSGIWRVSTTSAANRLLDRGIRSLDDLKIVDIDYLLTFLNTEKVALEAAQAPLSEVREVDDNISMLRRYREMVEAKPPAVGGNPMTNEEKRKRYHGPFLVNWQYGGYSYVEEDPHRPEHLWIRGMVDYANPDEVIAIAEREGIADISLAGSFWERVGYKGWGEKVSISEAKTALAKAKEQMRSPSSSVAIPSSSPIIRQQVPEEKGGNPMTAEEIDQVANKVAAKVLEEVSPSVLDPAGRGMLLHFTEHAIEGAGLVVNEARARATPCNCFTYKGRDYCFSKGIIGMISSEENPEQIAEYCKLGKTYEVQPGIKERFETFASAAEVAHEKIEEIPKGERLVPWLSAMGEELDKRGIEV